MHEATSSSFSRSIWTIVSFVSPDSRSPSPPSPSRSSMGDTAASSDPDPASEESSEDPSTLQPVKQSAAVIAAITPRFVMPQSFRR